MARLNVHVREKAYTHEGAPADAGLTPMQQLRRALLSCLLWEDQFYVDGESIAQRIKSAAEQCHPEDVAQLAVEARTVHNLRHAPLLLLDVLTRTGAGKPRLVAQTFERVIQRADELTEFMAIYMSAGRRPLSAQAKKGLARAFARFDGYQLAKYDRDGRWRLRDVLFLCHAKPSVAQIDPGAEVSVVDRRRLRHKGNVLERLINGDLPAPDTWEVALSAGQDKRETFERLLRERKLGYLALLRNLRNMEQAGCDRDLVATAIRERRGAERVLPFRFVAAARAAPSFEPVLDEALCAIISQQPPLKGKTAVLVDVSGSMDSPVSKGSDMTRMDAAATLASILHAEDLRVFSFSADVVEVPARRGMAGVDAIIRSQDHGSTYLGRAMNRLFEIAKWDRIIVVTDEQSHDPVPVSPCRYAYLINVASYEHGVSYRDGWEHIDGFSEAVLRYIYAVEAERAH